MAIELFGDKHAPEEPLDRHKQWHGISLTPVLKQHTVIVPGQVLVRCENIAISERMLKVYAYDFGHQQMQVLHFAWATFVVVASFPRAAITNDMANAEINTNNNLKRVENDTALVMTCLSAGLSEHFNYVNPIKPGFTFLTLWSWSFNQDSMIRSKASKPWMPKFQWRRML